MSAPDDIYCADGTLNHEYIRWLVNLAVQRGWAKRTRPLNESEINTLLMRRKRDAR